MKKTLTTLLLMSALPLMAQTNTFITGTMNIDFQTKTKPGVGSKDIYTISMDVCDSAVLYGTVTAQPWVIDVKVDKGYFKSTTNVVIQQRANLDYDLSCDVVRPGHSAADAVNRKKIGRMYGTVPIDTNGVYHYDLGTLECSTTASKATGTVIGKPQNRTQEQVNTSQLANVMMSFSKKVGNKIVTTQVTKYDKLTFENALIPSGPVPIYPEATVTGEMVYDYDRYTWNFNNLHIQFLNPTNNQIQVDTLSGDISWAEDNDRKHNGLGHYDFDIRVNEPLASEQAAFSGGNKADESSYFSGPDTSVPGLTGRMDYKDAMTPDGSDNTASAVTFNLTGNKLSKQEIMAIGKLVMFWAIVPMNSN